jgi:hypothetical protein
VAERILADWLRSSRDFVKVMPRDYRRAVEAARRLEAQAAERSAGVSERGAALSGPGPGETSLLQVVNG